jgi:hypothetical protein
VYEKEDQQVRCLDLNEEEALPVELSFGSKKLRFF